MADPSLDPLSSRGPLDPSEAGGMVAVGGVVDDGKLVLVGDAALVLVDVDVARPARWSLSEQPETTATPTTSAHTK